MSTDAALRLDLAGSRLSKVINTTKRGSVALTLNSLLLSRRKHMHPGSGFEDNHTPRIPRHGWIPADGKNLSTSLPRPDIQKGGQGWIDRTEQHTFCQVHPQTVGYPVPARGRSTSGRRKSATVQKLWHELRDDRVDCEKPVTGNSFCHSSSTVGHHCMSRECNPQR